MAINPLRKIETEDVVIYKDALYSKSVERQCMDIFNELKEKGAVKGEFKDNRWMCYSGVRQFGIDFSFDELRYAQHFSKEIGISRSTMHSMLRCYAVYNIGMYIFQTIQDKTSVVITFIEKCGDDDYSITINDQTTIEEFLAFINTPPKMIDELIGRTHVTKTPSAKARRLSPLINYLAVENEINEKYKTDIDTSEFVKWFPIYFWVNVTFILPLRATEMLVTPKNCITRSGDDVILTVRRTKLKKGFKSVAYDVEKDYEICKYKIPDGLVVKNIEKYIRLTAAQNRKYLFAHHLSINNMLSLQAFNQLLANFITENLIGNEKYDYARYASGIEEFSLITAGDSRPIAMSNLYFQNNGEEICMQLAGHESINTSAGYFTNVSETIWASALIKRQQMIHHEREKEQNNYRKGMSLYISGEKGVCMSTNNDLSAGLLPDCIAQDHLGDECIGCKFYRPTKEELGRYLMENKKRADDSAKRMIDFINGALSIKKLDVSIDQLFLSAQTNGSRYRMGCDTLAKEKEEEWLRRRSTQKTNC